MAHYVKERGIEKNKLQGNQNKENALDKTHKDEFPKLSWLGITKTVMVRHCQSC